ncbi:MAG: PASTA domain-containing protein [Acidobacteria bacterium]|nr:MAG: PASTA domain-containing protein [Acidobacteriota bacterium]
MGIARKSLSIFTKLAAVILLAMAFLAGMAGAIYFSLRGEEIKVPEIVGKDFSEGEKELQALGLKIKRRSYRYSQEKPNTILEQAPRPGEIVKTGQTILVVVAQPNPESTEAPASIKKNDEEGIFPDIQDETKKNRNTNVKRPERTRDVIKNKNANTGNTNVETNKNTASNKNTEDKPDDRNNKNNDSKPKATPTPAKSPSMNGPGDIRTRRIIP